MLLLEPVKLIVCVGLLPLCLCAITVAREEYSQGKAPCSTIR